MKKGSPGDSTIKTHARLLAVIAMPILLVLATTTVFTQDEKRGDVAISPATAHVAKDKISLVDKGVTSPGKGGESGGKGGSGPVTNPGPNLVTVTTYPFTNAAGAVLEDMSSGTTQLVGANLDDTASSLTNIGFDYWYDGVRFTQFSVNANGLCRLGGTVISTSFNNTADFAATTNAPKIAPYFDDLWTGTNGKVHFKVTGSSPSRKLIVEWLNEQIPRVGSGNTGAGTFQMWLFETTGVIEFVYGSGVALNATNGGYSIGLQSGGATNFASVTSTGPTVSYAAANNTQTNAITSGTKYTFTPNIPAAPTALNFTAVTPASMTLNWTDNASNEFGNAIYNSTDGTNFTFVTQTAANAVSQNVAGLTPSTTYFWRVIAVSEGALSTTLSGSQMTAAPGVITSTAVGGNWSLGATWVGGMVPTAGDNVTIVDGATVTIDTAAVALNVTVGQGASGVLQYESAIIRTLTVGQSVTIASGGIFQSSSVGTVTTHVLSVGANLTNNGTLDFSTNANTAAAILTFTGAANNSFSGTGATTDIRAITINKGTSSSNVLELMTSNFTVQGVTTDVAGFLTLTNGTFKISGTFTVTNRVFTTAIYTIPATAGIWLNNPNFVVAGTASSTTTANNGLFRVTQGTYNIGIGIGDEMGGGAGAVFIVEGGTVNASGRIDPQSAISYTQTAGTVNVATVGNNRSLFGSFEIFNTASSFTMSGGTINVINRNTGATQVDYDVLALTTNVTGGLLVIGAAGAPASTSYHVQGSTPNLTINPTMTMIVTNNASTNFPLFMRGATVTNNGTITSNAAGSRFDFTGTAPMSYTGGVFGTAGTPFGGVGVSANSTSLTTLNSPIVTNRVNLFQGGFINSNQITLGNLGASTTVVQIGSTGLTTAGGSFDVSPSHMQGTGGEIVLYQFETTPRTTGFEINPTRILTSMSVDQPNNVTIAGGNLTLSSTAGALTLTNGRVITGANILSLSSGTATVTRTNGYVDGNYRKAYAAAASKSFEVGTANGFSPVTVNVTAGTFPTDFTVKAVQGPQPNVMTPAHALQRYWTLTGSGVTATLTFNYLDPTDIPVTATESSFVIFKYDGAFSMPGGSVNTVANTATIAGVSSFSDWTLAAPNAPTDVALNWLTADSYAAAPNSPNGGALLRWQTGMEVANLGFNIYRDEAGKRVRVTPDMIAGSALFVGARTVLSAGRSYVWRDPQGANSNADYWLESVDINGFSTWYGPVRSSGVKKMSSAFEPNSRLLRDLGEDQTAPGATTSVETKPKQARVSAARLSTQALITKQPGVKIAVRREGWYRIPLSDLAAAGLDARVDPLMLQLLVDGQEQPINALTGKDGRLTAVEFYGIGADSPYTSLRTYWLVAGEQPGKRIEQIKSSSDSAAGGSFPYAVERRDRTVYFSSLRNGDKENFFGAVIARDAVDQTLTVQHLDTDSHSAGTLEVALQGVTTVAHSIGVELNGSKVGVVSFNSQSGGFGKFNVPSALLKEGQNVVRLTNQAGQGAVSLVDYIRLTYAHRYTAESEALRFTAASREQVTIDGFNSSDIRVLDVTNAGSLQELIGTVQPEKKGYSVSLKIQGSGQRTLLAVAGEMAKPVSVAANIPSTWRQPSNGADLIILTRRDFFAALDPLQSLRQKQGYLVALVDIDNVYDEFSFGQKTPQAVKDFCAYAAANWKKAPRFVLLAGDASLDPKNYLGFGDADLVPTRLVDTQLMETASDDWLVDFSGDGLPKMAIGRLPVRSADEALSLAVKIARYDGQRSAQTLLLVNDHNDTYDFEGASALLRGLIPANIHVETVDRARMDDATAKAKLIDAINRGQLIVNYSGHGSVNQWRGNILTSADAALLNSGEMSMFVMMTCLNGYFQDAALDSLGESLLKAEDGGAVAVWGSSGMTTPDLQSVLNQQAYRMIFVEKGLTIGEATARAKAAVASSDVRRTWILLGDPTTRLVR